MHSQYLLIAAYLASYNPAKTDNQYFAKVFLSSLCPALSPKLIVQHDGRKKKSKKRSRDHDAVPRSLLGPAAFPLERLLAIFYW
jgi:origin recognition complex subunit 5